MKERNLRTCGASVRENGNYWQAAFQRNKKKSILQSVWNGLTKFIMKKQSATENFIATDKQRAEMETLENEGFYFRGWTKRQSIIMIREDRYSDEIQEVQK